MLPQQGTQDKAYLHQNPSAETNMTFTCNGELDKDCPLDVIARFVK